MKILGAAAATGASYDECMSLGTAVSDQLVSIAATLDHCSVPGRSEHATLGIDEIELGTGPHNEPVMILAIQVRQTLKVDVNAGVYQDLTYPKPQRLHRHHLKISAG